jgi:hypothetical protein
MSKLAHDVGSSFTARHAWLWLLLVAIALGCAQTRTAEDDNGNTNWLRCTTDGDCPSGRPCVDGVCASAPSARIGEAGSAGQSSASSGALQDLAEVPDCPASVPAQADACTVRENGVCAYFGEEPTDPTRSFYVECACRAFCGSSATERHWDCYRRTNGPLIECPATPPNEGDSCFGLKGEECNYPVEVTCRCPSEADDSTWHCESEQLEPAQHPDVVDEGTVVRDLSDAERQAWCEWYTQTPGFPVRPNLEPTPDGYYPATVGCVESNGTDGCALTKSTGLSTEACVANLALSSCEATVRDLNDCVLTLDEHVASPYGCGRYIDAPGCAGTIVDGGPSNGQFEGSGGTSGGLEGHVCTVRVR